MARIPTMSGAIDIARRDGADCAGLKAPAVRVSRSPRPVWGVRSRQGSKGRRRGWSRRQKKPARSLMLACCAPSSVAALWQSMNTDPQPIINESLAPPPWGRTMVRAPGACARRWLLGRWTLLESSRQWPSRLPEERCRQWRRLRRLAVATPVRNARNTMGFLLQQRNTPWGGASGGGRCGVATTRSVSAESRESPVSQRPKREQPQKPDALSA